MSHNVQKKIAAINDISGFGRCALTVSLPIISHLRVQCCPVPTSILSNHTGFDSYFFDDYTEKLPAYLAQWKKLNLKFDAILSGFLGSKEQIAIVEAFIAEFRTGRTQVIVDPIMGDHGKIYTTYTEDMCREMRKLVSLADIVTPNVTECCKLTQTPYKQSGWHKSELLAMAEQLCEMGPAKIVITGIVQGEFIANYVYTRGETPKWFRTHALGTERAGTGDVFAAVVAADAVNGIPFDQSVKRASGFVKRCIAKTVELNIPRTDGVCFEEVLHTLKYR